MLKEPTAELGIMMVQTMNDIDEAIKLVGELQGQN